MDSEEVGDNHAFENESSSVKLSFTYLTTKSASRQARRGINRGKCKTYYSPCGYYLNTNRKRIYVHMGKCGNCSRLTKNDRIANDVVDDGSIMRNQLTRDDRYQMQIDKLTEEMERLKHDMHKFNYVQSIQLADLEADQLASHIFRRNKVEIEQVILKKIALVISESRKSKISVENNLMVFGEKIVNQIRKLNFDQCIEDYKSRLLTAHKQLMKSNYHLKTKQRYQSSFQFISRYSEIELKTFTNFFEDFLKLSPTKKKILRIYWQNIKKINPIFCNFPPLPQLKSEKSQRFTYSSQITIQKAAKKLLQLLGQNKFQLLCDIWLLLLLGLRFGDLLKIELYDSQKSYYKFIKLVQNKNKNLAVRYIPESLCILCEYTGTKYPLNETRLRAAVKYCLQKFRCAYGFKHKVISYIVAVFNQQSAFGKFHKASSTTSRFYIDKNCQFLLNSVFKFPITLNISEQRLQQIRNRVQMLDLTQIMNKKVIKIQRDVQNQIIIEDGANFQQRSAILDLDAVPFFNEQSPTLQAQISTNHQLQLTDREHDHIGSAILSVDTQNIVQQIQQNLSKQYDTFSNAVVFEQLSNITKRQVYYYMSNSDTGQLKQEVFTPANKTNETEIVVTKNKQSHFQITDFPIKRFRNSKKQAMSKITKRKVDVYKYLCKKCRQQGEFSRLQTQQQGVNCPSCDFAYHHHSSPTPIKTKIRIQWTGTKIHNFWPLVDLNQQENNVYFTINEAYPQSTRHYHAYTSDFPSNIEIAIPFINRKLQNELEKALKYEFRLPLRVKKSLIPHGGNGIFSNRRLGRNSLICVYRCLYGTSFSIDVRLNSNFTIGWTETQQGMPMELLADGITNAGIGRFFNCKPESQANCKVLMGVTESQIYIFFVTKQRIVEKDEQLFICYGDKYFFEDEKVQNEQVKSVSNQDSD